MRQVLALTIMFVLSVPACGQEWIARWNGPGNRRDQAKGIAVDARGNVYVAGTTRDSLAGKRGYGTVKHSSSGTNQWFNLLVGPGNFRATIEGIVLTGEGNICVTGSCVEYLDSVNCYTTIKYNSSGDTLWIRKYDGTGNNNSACAIAADDNGGICITGTSADSVGNYNYATVKYDSSGGMLWAARWNGPGNSNDNPTAIAVDSNGNVYVTGGSPRPGPNYREFATVKYDPLGQEQWSAIYNGPGNNEDQANAIVVDGSGNAYVTGRSRGIELCFDYATVKYDLSGTEQWVTRYNGPGNNDDEPLAIAVDGSGNIYVTGRSEGLGTSEDYATVKYNCSGDTLWVRRYNGTKNTRDWASAIAVDDAGNVYVTGCTNDSASNGDYATIKYDPSGNKLWVMKYNGPGNGCDYAVAIAVDGEYVYVSGTSKGLVNEDYATIKYTYAGVEEQSNIITQTVALEVSPNPFLHSTDIKYHVSTETKVSLKLHDISGRPVKTLVNGEKEAGSHSVSWSPKHLTPGIYFAKLSVFGEAGTSYKFTKKLILMR